MALVIENLGDYTEIINYENLGDYTENMGDYAENINYENLGDYTENMGDYTEKLTRDGRLKNIKNYFWREGPQSR